MMQEIVIILYKIRKQLLKYGPKPKIQLKTLVLEPINRGFPPHFQGLSIQHSPPAPRVRTTEDVQLPSRKDQALQVSKTDSERQNL